MVKIFKTPVSDEIPETRINEIKAVVNGRLGSHSSWVISKYGKNDDHFWLTMRTHSIAGSADFDYILRLSETEARYCVEELNIRDQWGYLKHKE